ncbi:MAG: DMT family transporter [Tissierellia bacterium]|nr:DMT family transporter [Tissierellia bacterium]
MKNNRGVYILAVLYATIIGLSFLFTKIALRFADPIDVLAYRFIASFVMISTIMRVRKITLVYNKEELKRLIILALFHPLAYFTFQTFGLKYASSSEAAIIQAASPIFILILATISLGEETNIYQKLFTLLSVFGVVYVIGMTSLSFESASIKGIILQICSALCFSVYNVMMRSLTKDFSSEKICYIISAGGFVGFGITAIIKNLIYNSTGNFLALSMNLNFILAIIYLGAIASATASLINGYVLYRIEAYKMSVFTNLRTIVSVLAGVLLLKEKIFHYHIIGSALIIFGVIGTNFLDNNGIERLKVSLREYRSP